MFKEQDQDIIKPREDVSFSVELPRLQTSRPRAKPLSSWLLVLWTHTAVNTCQPTGFYHSSHGPIYAYKHYTANCRLAVWNSGTVVTNIILQHSSINKRHKSEQLRLSWCASLWAFLYH